MRSVRASRLGACESEAAALQGTEQKHPPRVVEEQLVFGVTNEVGDLTDKLGVGYDDAGNGFDRPSRHGYLLCWVICNQSARTAAPPPCPFEPSFPQNATRCGQWADGGRQVSRGGDHRLRPLQASACVGC